MKQSRGISLDRIILLKATLLAATLVPALGLTVRNRPSSIRSVLTSFAARFLQPLANFPPMVAAVHARHSRDRV